jgi:hypothetical protein
LKIKDTRSHQVRRYVHKAVPVLPSLLDEVGLQVRLEPNRSRGPCKTKDQTVAHGNTFSREMAQSPEKAVSTRPHPTPRGLTLSSTTESSNGKRARAGGRASTAWFCSPGAGRRTTLRSASGQTGRCPYSSIDCSSAMTWSTEGARRARSLPAALRQSC